jgi:outer membrane protein TolC
LVTLRRLVGKDIEVKTTLKPVAFVDWANESKFVPVEGFEEILASRGNYRIFLSRLQAARADLRQSEDDLKPDVSLHVGATWQGEHEFLPVGNDLVASDKHVGGEVTLVYTRPLNFREERAQRSRWQARIGELNEQLQQTANEVRAEIRTSELFYRRAAERLAILSKARDAAIKTLDAENERFRLGEGRSRNVLDAQKDLTTINQRLTQTAAELLRALADYNFATGYGRSE